MRLFRYNRDIIIITGCNAVGKTTASNYLRNWASLHNIPQENTIVADSHCLFEAMQDDDETGGHHHTHNWCQSDQHGHNYNDNQPEFPFTVTDNTLPDAMRINFFSKLTNLETGKLWFAEWAAGVNTNPPDDSSSNIDYSYAKVKSMLQNKSISAGWLKRVKAVVHISANECMRFDLNKRRLIPSTARPEAIEKGTAFWQKDEQVLRFYGKDDFAEIKDLLEAHNIDIHTIENDGDERFYHKLAAVADEIFVTGKTPVAKLLSGMATITKHSLIYIQISHIFSRLRQANERKQQETQPPTVTEPVKEKASV